MSALPKIKLPRQPSVPERELLIQVRAYGLPEPVTEYRFHEMRRWRFDVAFVEQKVAIEVEGGTWIRGGGRHNRGAGYEADCRKYATALEMGWRVLRVTPAMIHDGSAVQHLWNIIAKERR